MNKNFKNRLLVLVALGLSNTVFCDGDESTKRGLQTAEAVSSTEVDSSLIDEVSDFVIEIEAGEDDDIIIDMADDEDYEIVEEEMSEESRSIGRATPQRSKVVEVPKPRVEVPKPKVEVTKPKEESSSKGNKNTIIITPNNTKSKSKIIEVVNKPRVEVRLKEEYLPRGNKRAIIITSTRTRQNTTSSRRAKAKQSEVIYSRRGKAKQSEGPRVFVYEAVGQVTKPVNQPVVAPAKPTTSVRITQPQPQPQTRKKTSVPIKPLGE